MSDARTPMGDVKNETVSAERLRTLLANEEDNLRYLHDNDWGPGHVRACQERIHLLTELLALRQPDTRMEGGGEAEFVAEYEVTNSVAAYHHAYPDGTSRAGHQGMRAALEDFVNRRASAAPSSPTVGELEVVATLFRWREKGSLKWLYTDVTPDADDRRWNEVHEIGPVVTLSSAQSSIQRAEAERDGWKRQEREVAERAVERIDELEAQLAEARKVLEAVGHIGVDFGYGPYVLEEKHIEAARALVASLGEKQDAE